MKYLVIGVIRLLRSRCLGGDGVVDRDGGWVSGVAVFSYRFDVFCGAPSGQERTAEECGSQTEERVQNGNEPSGKCVRRGPRERPDHESRSDGQVVKSDVAGSGVF